MVCLPTGLRAAQVRSHPMWSAASPIDTQLTNKVQQKTDQQRNSLFAATPPPSAYFVLSMVECFMLCFALYVVLRAWLFAFDALVCLCCVPCFPISLFCPALHFVFPLAIDSLPCGCFCTLHFRDDFLVYRTPEQFNFGIGIFS